MVGHHAYLGIAFSCEVILLNQHSSYVLRHWMSCYDFCSFFCIRDVSFEIIVIDDASPDGTQAVVRQLQKLYGEERIVWIFSGSVMHDSFVLEHFHSLSPS